MDKTMIPVWWIEAWAKKRPVVYDERSIRKMLEDWKAETSGEERSTYIFADDLAKVGNRTVNQKEGSN